MPCGFGLCARLSWEETTAWSYSGQWFFASLVWSRIHTACLSRFLAAMYGTLCSGGQVFSAESIPCHAVIGLCMPQRRSDWFNKNCRTSESGLLLKVQVIALLWSRSSESYNPKELLKP